MSDTTDALSQRLSPVDVLIVCLGSVVLYGLLISIGPGIRGPDYLTAFFLMWVFLTVLHVALRRRWRDHVLLSIAAAAILAGVALARYQWGVAHGMQRWNYLFVMTFLGCATFFVRAKQFERGPGSSRWGCSAASCGSTSSASCSSGGGCGGGGGGCGGCGGD